MGMYDTINGEQVKCFPRVYLYKEEIGCSGGGLKCFNNGAEVPYKAPHYNYGKNFVILDYNRFPDSKYDNYDYIIHVIVDGKVKRTFRDKIGRIDWKKNECVVGYYGELFNVKSNEEILAFIKDQREYKKRLEKINTHWNELFAKSMKYFTGLGLVEKDSKEYKLRWSKIEKCHILMDEEKARIKPEEDALNKEYEHWLVDISAIEDCIALGDYISADSQSYRDSTAENEFCQKMIRQMLQADSTLYDRYVKWQGDDAFLAKYL